MNLKYITKVFLFIFYIYLFIFYFFTGTYNCGDPTQSCSAVNILSASTDSGLFLYCTVILVEF